MLQACIGNGGDIEFLVKRTQVPQKLVAAFVRCPDSESEIALLQLVSSLLSGLPTCASDLRDGDVDKCVLRVGFKHAAACEGKSVDILRLCVFCARHFARANRRRNAYLDSVFIFCSHAIRILETDVSELLADVCQLLVRYDFYEEHPTLFVSVVAASPFVRLRHSAVLQFVDNVVLHVPTALAPEYASRACSAGQLLCDPSAVDLALPLLCLLQRCVDIVGYKELSALLSFTLLRDCRNTILAKGDSGGKRAFAMFMLGFPLNECYPAGLAHFWTPISWLVSHTVLTPADYHKAFNAEYDSAAAATFDNRVASILKTHIGQLQAVESTEVCARPSVVEDEASSRTAIANEVSASLSHINDSITERVFQREDLPVLAHMRMLRQRSFQNFLADTTTRRECAISDIRRRRKEALEGIAAEHRIDPREVAVGEQEAFEHKTKLKNLLAVERQKYCAELDCARAAFSWMLQQGKVYDEVLRFHTETLCSSELFAVELKEELLRGAGWYGVVPGPATTPSVVAEEALAWGDLLVAARTELPSPLWVDHTKGDLRKVVFEEALCRVEVQSARQHEFMRILERAARAPLKRLHKKLLSGTGDISALYITVAKAINSELPDVSVFSPRGSWMDCLAEEEEMRELVVSLQDRLACQLLSYYEKVERAMVQASHPILLLHCDLLLRETAEREDIYSIEQRMRDFWEEEADPCEVFAMELITDFYTRDYIECRTPDMSFSLTSQPRRAD